MPTFGAYGTFPIRFGGAKRQAQVITEGLNAARGTAYDVAPDSTVWVDDHAVARALASVWEYNELLGNQFVPRTMSIMLTRWEKILGLSADPAMTIDARRARVQTVVSRTGVTPNYQGVLDRLNAIVAPVTTAIQHNAPSDAGTVSSWPGGWYIVPLGTTPPTVTLTGQPAADYTFQLAMVAGGIVTVATFRYSTDGGMTFSATLTTAPTVVLGSTGLTASFSAGTYNADNRYFASPFTVGFTSTVGRVTVVATKPTWMSESEYFDRVQGVFAFLDAALPAWVTFDVVRDGTVVGQFRLDEDGNLDGQRL